MLSSVSTSFLYIGSLIITTLTVSSAFLPVKPTQTITAKVATPTAIVGTKFLPLLTVVVYIPPSPPLLFLGLLNNFIKMPFYLIFDIFITYITIYVIKNLNKLTIKFYS